MVLGGTARGPHQGSTMRATNPARRRLVIGVAALAVVAVVAGGWVVAARPAAAVTGLVVVTATSAEDLGGWKAALATCPAGTKILGGGGSTTGGGRHVHIYALVPEDNGADPDSFWAGAFPHDLYTGPYAVTVWAVCGVGVTGHSIVEVDGPARPGAASNRATASCPGNTRVIGVGGIAFKTPFILDSVYPSANLNSVTAVGSRPEGFSDRTRSIGVTAYAICVDPVPGLQLFAVPVGPDSVDKPIAVGCPTGATVHSVGGSLTGASGQAFFDAVAPGDGLAYAYVSAREDATGYARTWTASAYVICAT